jgi:hypothetical protein
MKLNIHTAIIKQLLLQSLTGFLQARYLRKNVENRVKPRFVGFVWGPENRTIDMAEGEVRGQIYDRICSGTIEIER